MTLTIAMAYGGREEIADAVHDLIRAKVRDGLGVDELTNTSAPLLSTNTLQELGLSAKISLRSRCRLRHVRPTPPHSRFNASRIPRRGDEHVARGVTAA